MSPESELEQFAHRFLALASGIQGERPEATVTEALGQAEALARKLSESGASTETRTLAAQLTTALQTWRTVWPRMGSQREFRSAVAREAVQWAKRLSPAAPKTPPPHG